MDPISYQVPRYRLRSKLTTGVSANAAGRKPSVNKTMRERRIRRLLHHFRALVLASRSPNGEHCLPAAAEATGLRVGTGERQRPTERYPGTSSGRRPGGK